MLDHFQLQDKLKRVQRQLQSYVETSELLEQETLVRFFVRIVPELFRAERCGIFFIDPHNERIWSKYGTELRDGELEITAKDSIAGQVVQSGKTYLDNDIEKTSGDQKRVEESTGFKVRNILCTPIRQPNGTDVVGVIQVLNKRRGFKDDDRELIEELGNNLFRSLQTLWLHERLSSSSSSLSTELDSVNAQINDKHPLVATDPKMTEVIRSIVAVSRTPANILLRGENGTGKEVAARLIHQHSQDPESVFVAVNCAAIPETLLESEFFGYEKGAFTGANRTKHGYLEEAKGGVLFLDEVGELPLAMQAKLLRVLQEKEGRRLGSNETISYDFRVLSATNRDLDDMVRMGTFREDLYYRLFAVSIDLPALRERPRDIPLLTMRFFKEVSEGWNKHFQGISPEVLEAFERYRWPGNVRQLKREVERMAALAQEHSVLSIEHCSEDIRAALEAPRAALYHSGESLKAQVQSIEQRIIQAALEEYGGHREKTARALGITRQTLHAKMKSA